MTVEQFDPSRHDFDRVIDILALSTPQPVLKRRSNGSRTSTNKMVGTCSLD